MAKNFDISIAWYCISILYVNVQTKSQHFCMYICFNILIHFTGAKLVRNDLKETEDYGNFCPPM